MFKRHHLIAQQTKRPTRTTFRRGATRQRDQVRFRFAMVGANFWDWGFDNFGIYTKPTSTPSLQASIAQEHRWTGATGAGATAIRIRSQAGDIVVQ